MITSVIVPTYNEAENIELLIRRIGLILKEDYEIVEGLIYCLHCGELVGKV